MGLNCKPGDLAIVVRANDGVSGIIGSVVRVTVPHVINGKPAWRLETPLSCVMRMGGRACGVRVKAGEFVQIDGVPDAWLKPLRDSDGEDEMLRIAGRPNVLEVA